MNRRPNLRSHAFLAGCLMAAALLAGCATPPTASSPAGMKYSGGNLSAVEDVPMDQLWRASRAALDALDIVELDVLHGNTAAYLEGRTTDLKKVSVKMRPLAPSKTELKIRVSTFGDSNLSQQIYEKIQTALAP
ncbi:MAG: DUF3568 family protein [Verrucomicrobiae bacterium]|nr:DUF3568 family protein [Verrucomicrobiae bacterium]